MSDHRFLFALTLADEPRFDTMLGDVAASVLAHVGYGQEAIADMLGLLRGAIARGAAGGFSECQAQFRAEAGQLLIVVSYPGGGEWRATRPLP